MPLASCHISGIFSLSGGFRYTEPAYYAEYLSSLEFPVDHKFINVSVRKFTPSSESLLPDNSFVFMVAKAALPAEEDGMLDSIYCTPFNPSSEGSEQPITANPTHTAFVTGTVRSVNSDGPIRSFTLTTGEFVRGEARTFDIRFVLSLKPAYTSCLLTCAHISFKYDGTSNRWKNVRLPVAGSIVTATGTFEDMFGEEDNNPVLNLLDVNYGATNDSVAHSPTRTVGHRGVQR